MTDNAVSNRISKHEILCLSRRIQQGFNGIYDVQSLLFMPKTLSRLVMTDFLQDPLAQMPEGWMTQIMAQSNGADKLRI